MSTFVSINGDSNPPDQDKANAKKKEHHMYGLCSLDYNFKL